MIWHNYTYNITFLTQLVDSLLSQVILYKWPRWVEICTFVSHFLLALGASVNILLYCSCDKRFFVVVQKTLKAWYAPKKKYTRHTKN